MTSSFSISTNTDRFELGAIPLIDHHAHPLRRDQALAGGAMFRRFWSESSDARMATHLGTTIFYRRVIRDLATLLECDPTEAAVLAARGAIPPDAYIRRCFDAARIGMLLLDTGFQTAESVALGEMATLSAAPVAQILRLETTIEALVGQTSSLAELEEALRRRVRGASDEGIVALKSIAAYRGGLRLEPRHASEAAAARDELRAMLERTGRCRLEQRPLLEYLLYAALEEAATSGLPVQFHVAFGDDDADLRLANPLHLRTVLRDRRLQDVQIVLLHCYPYVREAGYLANLYANVFVDVSLSVPLTAAGSSVRFAEALELAPSAKLLFATDAHSIPELFYIGALHGRRALDHCLAELVTQEYLTYQEAEEVARQVLSENARQLYRL